MLYDIKNLSSIFIKININKFNTTLIIKSNSIKLNYHSYPNIFNHLINLRSIYKCTKKKECHMTHLFRTITNLIDHLFKLTYPKPTNISMQLIPHR